MSFQPFVLMSEPHRKLRIRQRDRSCLSVRLPVCRSVCMRVSVAVCLYLCMSEKRRACPSIRKNIHLQGGSSRLRFFFAQSESTISPRTSEQSCAPWNFLMAAAAGSRRELWWRAANFSLSKFRNREPMLLRSDLSVYQKIISRVEIFLSWVLNF